MADDRAVLVPVHYTRVTHPAERSFTVEKIEQQLEIAAIVRDAMRYRRLRILGAAIGGSIHEQQGTVQRFTNLDNAVDEDIKNQRTRGEAKEMAGFHDSDAVIDRKFIILAVNPINGKVYDETNSILFAAKDAAVPEMLAAYAAHCMRLGANPEHLQSVRLLRERVIKFQEEMGGGRVPDTVGAEIPRCLHGEGV